MPAPVLKERERARKRERLAYELFIYALNE